MRFATIEYKGKEVVTIQTDRGMVTLESIDVQVQDMNELV